MATRRAKREVLRGLAERVLDHVFEAFSSKQMAELLKATERAVRDGDKDLVQKLVEAGAGIGCGLHEAVGGRDRVIVDILLASGAPMKSRNAHGHPALHIAAEAGDADMILLLLLKGAGKDTLDARRNTALCVAAELGHLAATKSLLTGGVGYRDSMRHVGEVGAARCG